MENKYFDLLSKLELINVELTMQINNMKRASVSEESIVKRKLNDLRLGFLECVAVVEKAETL